MGTKNRGFASMDRDLQKSIATKGGKAVSQDREHMRAIGRLGGINSGKNRRAAASTQDVAEAAIDQVNQHSK